MQHGLCSPLVLRELIDSGELKVNGFKAIVPLDLAESIYSTQLASM